MRTGMLESGRRISRKKCAPPLPFAPRAPSPGPGPSNHPADQGHLQREGQELGLGAAVPEAIHEELRGLAMDGTLLRLSPTRLRRESNM